jgi:hypothetical protein
MFGWFGGAKAVGNQAVTVLYVKNARSRGERLGDSLREVAAQYGSRVRLVPVSRMPGYGFLRPCQPTIRVMRGPAVVGEAIGADLPRRELDRVIRGALATP